MTAADTNWVIVYSFKLLYKAEMMQMILKDEGIESVIINKQDSSYLIGEIELYVNSIDLIKAKNIIDNAENKE